jgi:hypothetical protein
MQGFSMEKVQHILDDPTRVSPPTEYSFFDDRHKLHAHKQTFVPIHTNKEYIFAMIITDMTPVYRSEAVTKVMHTVSHAVNETVSLEDLFATIHSALGKTDRCEQFLYRPL